MSDQESYGLLWVPHKDDVFVLAEFLAMGASGKLLVETNPQDPNAMNREKLEVPVDDAFHVEEIHLHNQVKDICHLYTDVAHPAPTLHYFKKSLFHRGVVYVSASNALFSVNPYQERPRLYSAESKTKYMNASADELVEMPAHIYNFGKKVFLEMLESNPSTTVSNKLNQSIVVSGESGSGKTENAKYLSAFIVKASQHGLKSIPESNDSNEAKNRADELENILQYSNTVFETFGNAKTTLNDNASRFAKQVKLQFTKKNQLVSVYTETSMLEKSRLTQVIEGERNYHIFYQLFRGMGSAYPELKQSLRLYDVKDFKMLTTGNCLTMKTVHQDVQGFHATVKALRALGASEDELRALWTLIAVMLHLGNAEVYRHGASPNDDESTGGDDQGEGPCDIVIDTLDVKEIAALLGVDASTFSAMLTTKETEFFSPERVQVNIHGFLKHIYKGIYFWIVRKVNHQGAYFGKLLGEPVKYIGVVDIFGSENKGVDGNSLEQLVINLANERMKGHFNESTFLNDEKLYTEENVPCEFISYTSNDSTIEFLTSSSPEGLMPVLDKLTQAQKVGTDQLLESMQHASAAFPAAKSNDSHAIFSVTGNNFRVRHFTGDVDYNADQLMPKNLESTGIDYGGILNSSSNTFLQATLGIGSSVKEGEIGHIPWLNNPLVMPKTAAALKTKTISGGTTIWGQFSGQLETLMASIGGSQSHYVKCIRPNRTESTEEFNPAYVLSQIEHQGLLDVANMIKEGLPERMKFKEFYSRYEVLRLSEDWPWAKGLSDNACKSYASQIAGALLSTSAFAVGTTQIFIKDGCTEFMDHNVSIFYDANATMIQAHFRRFRDQKKYQINIIKHRQKKAAAEQAKSILADDGTIRRESIHQHSVQYDVFSAINIMQSKGRRSTSPMLNLQSSPHTLPSALFGHVDDNADGEDEDSKQIRKLHEFYMSRMELIKTFIRNVLIRRRTSAIFDSVTNGDQEKVMTMLRRRPELINVLDKDNDFCTLQHAALRAGDFEMCKILGLSPITLVIRDAGDHSAVHYAALTPSLSIFKLFYKTLSTLLGFPKYTFATPAPTSSRAAKGTDDANSSPSKSASKSSKGGKKEGTSAVSKLLSPATDIDAAGGSPKGRFFSGGDSDTPKSQMSSNFKSPLNKGDSKDSEEDPTINTRVYRMGTMFKINLSGRVAKRLFVLKDNRLRYYPLTNMVGQSTIAAVNMASNIKESKSAFATVQLPEYATDEFMVTQQDCFFSRYNVKGKDDLAIVLNFAQPSNKKRRSKLIIKANNERELQQWVLNLSQIASFDRFRSYAPRFRNPLFTRSFLSQVTWAKESALHTLVHSAGSKLRKAKADAFASHPESGHGLNEGELLFDHISSCAWLVDHGCPINLKNYEGQTALHIAVEAACYPIVSALTVKGAQVDIKDFNAKTPLDLCDSISPEDLGYDLEDVKMVLIEAEEKQNKKDEEQKNNTPLSKSGLDALDASVSIKRYDAAEQRRLEEEELLEQQFAEKRMACEDLINHVQTQVNNMGRNMKHIMRQEAREYQRMQVPINNKTRMLPSPLTPNMGLRNPYQSPHSGLMPPQKKGYSYMTIHLQRQGIELNSAKGGPENGSDAQNFGLVAGSSHLVIGMGLYNGTTHNLVEPIQELERPVHRDASGNFVWWGSNYYIQTPLEFLPDSCYLTFRFFLKSTNPSVYQTKGGQSQSQLSRNIGEPHDGSKGSSESSDDEKSDSDGDESEDTFRQIYNDRPVELIDIDISRATFVLDKALLDSGYVKLNMRDHRDTARIFSVGGGGEDEHDQDPSAAGSGQADKVSSSPFSSFDAYVPGGSLKSTLEMEIEICEYFEPISIKDVIMNKVDGIHAYSPGVYHNNPPHLLGASHDKNMAKTKKGVMKTVPELFALSYFEGGSSERYHITLPIHANGGDLIRNIGGFPHIDVRMPGHIRAGQNVVVVVPKYWSGPVPDNMPEVFAEDFNKNLTNAERLQYQLPAGVAEGPYVVQNVDGSRRISFKVTRSMVQKLLANGDDGLSIIIVLNSWVKELDLVATSLGANADKKGGPPGLGLFSAFLDAPSSGGGKSAGDGEDFSYNDAYGQPSDTFEKTNPMRSKSRA